MRLVIVSCLLWGVCLARSHLPAHVGPGKQASVPSGNTPVPLELQQASAAPLSQLAQLRHWPVLPRHVPPTASGLQYISAPLLGHLARQQIPPEQLRTLDLLARYKELYEQSLRAQQAQQDLPKQPTQNKQLLQRGKQASVLSGNPPVPPGSQQVSAAPLVLPGHVPPTASGLQYISAPLLGHLARQQIPPEQLRTLDLLARYRELYEQSLRAQQAQQNLPKQPTQNKQLLQRGKQASVLSGNAPVPPGSQQVSAAPLVLPGHVPPTASGLQYISAPLLGHLAQQQIPPEQLRTLDLLARYRELYEQSLRAQQAQQNLPNQPTQNEQLLQQVQQPQVSTNSQPEAAPHRQIQQESRIPSITKVPLNETAMTPARPKRPSSVPPVVPEEDPEEPDSSESADVAEADNDTGSEEEPEDLSDVDDMLEATQMGEAHDIDSVTTVDGGAAFSIFEEISGKEVVTGRSDEMQFGEQKRQSALSQQSAAFQQSQEYLQLLAKFKPSTKAPSTPKPQSLLNSQTTFNAQTNPQPQPPSKTHPFFWTIPAPAVKPSQQVQPIQQTQPTVRSQLSQFLLLRQNNVTQLPNSVTQFPLFPQALLLPLSQTPPQFPQPQTPPQIPQPQTPPRLPLSQALTQVSLPQTPTQSYLPPLPTQSPLPPTPPQVPLSQAPPQVPLSQAPPRVPLPQILPQFPLPQKPLQFPLPQKSPQLLLPQMSSHVPLAQPSSRFSPTQKADQFPLAQKLPSAPPVQSILVFPPAQKTPVTLSAQPVPPLPWTQKFSPVPSDQKIPTFQQVQLPPPNTQIPATQVPSIHVPKPQVSSQPSTDPVVTSSSGSINNPAFPWDSFRAYLRGSSINFPSLARRQGTDRRSIEQAEDRKVIAVVSDNAGQEAEVKTSGKTQPARPKAWWQYYLDLERPQSELEPRAEPLAKWWLKYKDENSNNGSTEGSSNLNLWQTINRHGQEKREEEEKRQRRGERWRRVKDALSSVLGKFTNGKKLFS